MRHHQERHHHRAGESGDFSTHRNGPSGSYKKIDPLVKWAVGTFLSLFVLGATTLALSDRTDIKTDAEYGRAGVDRLDGRVGIVETKVEHLEEGQKQIIRGQQKIIDTLYTLPADRRSQPKPILAQPTED